MINLVIMTKTGYHLLLLFLSVIFKVYDSDCNGKVSFNDILGVLRDLSGSFMSDEQREVSLRIDSLFLFNCVLLYFESIENR